MLLETLDLRTNDVLIYSQNMFNFNNSFKIIYKNEKNKRPKRISYFDVCAYVKDPSPKNLVIYRLLTNVNSLDAYSTKYGYFIKINGKAELVYFDPIFAIKDLRHLRFDFDPKKFRFKIQQVGLTSLTKKEAEPSFAEVYSFDLRAIEAQNQNDKIFADAIFAFDPGYNDEEEPTPSEKGMSDEGKMERFFRSTKETPKTKTDHIAEDKGTKGQSLSPLNTPEGVKVQDLREEIIGLLKQAMGIEGGVGSKEKVVGSREEKEKDNSKLEIINDKLKSRNDKKEETLREVQSDNKYEGRGTKLESKKDKLEMINDKLEIEEEEKREKDVIGQKAMVNKKAMEERDVVNVFDLFKTTTKSNELSDRAKESIVLKFE